MLDEKPHLSVIFGSDIGYVGIIEKLSRKFCTIHGFDGTASDDYSVSVRELVINAIKHGNKNNPEKMVKIEFYETDKEVRTFVQDEGEERFDPGNYFAATGENVLSNHGRGLFFVNRYTPGWTYEWMNPGNRFRIYKEKFRKSLLANESQLCQQRA